MSGHGAAAAKRGLMAAFNDQVVTTAAAPRKLALLRAFRVFMLAYRSAWRF
jgi:hypothetical protein